MPKRREFSKADKAEMVRRSTRDGVVHCEGCDAPLKTWEYDHTIPEALFLDKSRKLTADDGKLLGYCCHRGPDGKTKKDVQIIAKVKRQENKHRGVTKPKGNIKSQGWTKAEKVSKIKDPFNLPRPSLYKPID